MDKINNLHYEVSLCVWKRVFPFRSSRDLFTIACRLLQHVNRKSESTFGPKRHYQGQGQSADRGRAYYASDTIEWRSVTWTDGPTPYRLVLRSRSMLGIESFDVTRLIWVKSKSNRNWSRVAAPLVTSLIFNVRLQASYWVTSLLFFFKLPIQSFMPNLIQKTFNFITIQCSFLQVYMLIRAVLPIFIYYSFY